jgi:hypothetical protein
MPALALGPLLRDLAGAWAVASSLLLRSRLDPSRCHLQALPGEYGRPDGCAGRLTETTTETRTSEGCTAEVPPSDVLAGQPGGGYEIRTREGFPPTRFPSVRPRPLGESSVG